MVSGFFSLIGNVATNITTKSCVLINDTKYDVVIHDYDG